MKTKIYNGVARWLKRYASLRMMCLLLLGFSSGLPLALVTGTLQAWFKTSGASVVALGFMTLISQPYSYKFIWAPLLDKFNLQGLIDRRRSWILIMQLAIVSLIALMSLFTPAATVSIFGKSVPWLCILAFVLCFCSATQDIVIDAYRAEILGADERGLGAALSIEGYRVAMLVSGGVALVLAEKLGWNTTYLLMSALMALGIVATLLSPKLLPLAEKANTDLFANTAAAFGDFFKRDKALVLLLLIICYKLGDAFSHALGTPFLLDLGFVLSEVAWLNKIVGLIATLCGVLLGGSLMTGLGLYTALFGFGILAAITNLGFMLLAYVGKSLSLAALVIFVENLCSGMGTAAFVALLMSLCNPRFTATQYALLSSLSAVGRIYVGPISGYMVKYFGWTVFYGFSAVAALPGLILLLICRNATSTENKPLFAAAV